MGHTPAQYACLATKAAAMTPLIRNIGADEFCQVHTSDARKLACMLDGCLGVNFTGHDATRLHAFLTNDSGEFAGIDVCDSDRVPLPQKITEGAL